jgi:hypothetical protein
VKYNSILDRLVLEVEKGDTSLSKNGYMVKTAIRYGARDLIAADIEKIGKDSGRTCEEELNLIESRLDSLNPR